MDQNERSTDNAQILTQKTAERLETIYSLLPAIPERHRYRSTRIGGDYSEDRSIMPLAIEVIDYGSHQDIEWEDVSLCQYFLCNGDLCQDPEIVFRRITSPRRGTPLWVPVILQIAIPPVYEELITFAPDCSVQDASTKTEDVCHLANLWLANLAEQFDLDGGLTQ